MNKKIQMLGVWSGAIFFVAWIIGFVFFAGWIPPISPAASAPEVAAIFQARIIPIRIAMVIMTVFSILYLPFSVIISDLIKDIEKPSYLLSVTQIGCGIIGTIGFIIPAYVFTAVAFRPDRDPVVMLAMMDFAWLFFITTLGPFALQYIAIAIAVFNDKKPEPTFPRWVGFVQVWVAVSYLPAPVAFFFKQGPFAWDGLFVWWIPFSTFTIWIFVMLYACRRAILKAPEHPEHHSLPQTAATV